MSSLPSEILTLIFNHLRKKDLLQCQLVSKQWYINSMAHTYSNVNLALREDAERLYIRAISNSPQLGKYLNIIELSDVLDDGTDDGFSILETVIQHCPNIIEIKCDIKDESFWNLLMQAGTQGQLPHLKVLPHPDYLDLTTYADTVLSFKNSLTSVLILGDDDEGGYRTLCDQLDQFKSLQRLDFGIQTYPYLSHFDGLIDKCPQLKELTFMVDTDAIQRPNGPEPTIRPRPGISKLECDWQLICIESQLGYVMHKFPNLQSLRIRASDNVFSDSLEEPEVSGPALVRFIQYVVSILDFSLGIFVRKEDLSDIFIAFMKTKNGCKNVNIGYVKYLHPSFSLCELILSATIGWRLKFDSNTGDNEIKHIRFLSEVGRSLRSLEVDDFCMIPDINGETSESIDQLFDILRLCPSLEECTIKNAKSILGSHHQSKYPSLKKLSIFGLEDSKPFRFLNPLSLNLPNLRKLSLGLGFTSRKDTHPIVINLPHLSLDLLTWHDYSMFNYDSGIEVYIKLKTERGSKYYYCNRYGLIQADESSKLLKTRDVRFDIDCKDLKEFKIIENYGGHHYNWIF
ncbi:hypothetical protein HPULCUR_000768 [Helicostylum pulchrum]|uniref:F-box domain-containing protein n=1 Tax=Helicostylum pulchrum TaxID=562976 RepID=A0ABP9XKU7_9FUNG